MAPGVRPDRVRLPHPAVASFLSRLGRIGARQCGRIRVRPRRARSLRPARLDLVGGSWDGDGDRSSCRWPGVWEGGVGWQRKRGLVNPCCNRFRIACCSQSAGSQLIHQQHLLSRFPENRVPEVFGGQGSHPGQGTRSHSLRVCGSLGVL